MPFFGGEKQVFFLLKTKKGKEAQKRTQKKKTNKKNK